MASGHIENNGIGAGPTDGTRLTIDAIEPSTKEDFDRFHILLRDKLLKYETSPHYVSFLETLSRDLALGLEAEDVKKLSATLNTLCNEKTKEKLTKAKKKTKQSALPSAREDMGAFGSEGGVGYEDKDMEDFM